MAGVSAVKYKPRVNASMLPNHHGQRVILLGCVLQANDIQHDGSAFTLYTTDAQKVNVVMRNKLTESISGVVEVRGEVDQRNQVHCDSVRDIVTFPAFSKENLDCQLYENAINQAIDDAANYARTL